jgi:hypothetical protein
MKMPIAGGSPSTVASGWQRDPISSIAVDATSVYFTLGGSVLKAPK